MDNTKNNQRIWQVSFLRGIAIIMVVLVHSAQPFKIHGLEFMQMGCQIFFVLSGFTLALSYDKHYTDYKSFLQHRYTRLLPGYAMTICLGLIVSGISTLLFKKNITGIDTNLADIIINLFMIHGLFPTKANNRVVRGGWFVGTIVLLYVTFPFFMKLFKNKKDNKLTNFNIVFLFIFINCVIAVILKTTLDYTIENNSFEYFSVVNQLPSFILGIVLYNFKDRIDYNKEKLLLMIFLLGISIIVFYIEYTFSFVLLPGIFSIFTIYLFVLLRKLPDNTSNNIIVKSISKIGDISFPIYLIHSFIVYDAIYFVKKAYQYINRGEDTLILYFILLPFIFISAVFAGNVYNVIIKKVSSLILINEKHL